MAPPNPQRVAAPANHEDHQHSSHFHDAQGLFAGFRYALDVLPPEINGNQRGKERRGCVCGEDNVDVRVAQKRIQKARQVVARRDATDRSCKDVIEHQGGNGELGQSPTHGFFDHAVDAAAHKHAATFHVHEQYRVGEQHDGQYEPGRSLPYSFLNDSTRIEG